MNTISFGGSLVAALLLSAAPARAVSVLDAFYGGGSAQASPYAFRLGSVTPALAETFTAGASGLLTGFGLFLVPLPGAAATVTVALTTTLGGDPGGGVVLAQRSFQTSAVTSAGFYDFDVAAAAAGVTANSVYALVASVETDDLNLSAGLGGDFPDSYGGGQAYFGLADALLPVARTALFFRTFVAPYPVIDPAPFNVPEPATVLLLGLGALGAGTAGRLGRHHGASLP